MAKESYYQGRLIKRLEKDGWLVLNLIKTKTSGIPDVVAMKKEETHFIECKTADGVVSELQKYRLNDIVKRGMRASVLIGNDLIDWRVYRLTIKNQ